MHTARSQQTKSEVVVERRPPPTIGVFKFCATNNSELHTTVPPTSEGEDRDIYLLPNLIPYVSIERNLTSSCEIMSHVHRTTLRTYRTFVRSTCVVVKLILG